MRGTNVQNAVFPTLRGIEGGGRGSRGGLTWPISWLTAAPRKRTTLGWCNMRLKFTSCRNVFRSPT
eukprot:860050-Prorocentrum_minimum.AAC.1